MFFQNQRALATTTKCQAVPFVDFKTEFKEKEVLKFKQSFSLIIIIDQLRTAH